MANLTFILLAYNLLTGVFLSYMNGLCTLTAPHRWLWLRSPGQRAHWKLSQTLT